MRGVGGLCIHVPVNTLLLTLLLNVGYYRATFGVAPEAFFVSGSLLATSITQVNVTLYAI